MTTEPNDIHSQLIRFAKIGFPLLAALLIVGVFLFTKKNPIRDGIIVSAPKIAELAIGQKITNPHYAGVTRAGDAFSISAESALPNAPAPDQVDLEAPHTTIGFADGLEVQALANFGYLNLRTQVVTLTNSVSLKTSNDFMASTEIVVINFRTGNAYCPGPIEATGPMGRITAGKMSLTQNLQRNTSQSEIILSFGNGVKLVYYPTEKIK